MEVAFGELGGNQMMRQAKKFGHSCQQKVTIEGSEAGSSFHDEICIVGELSMAP